MAQRAVGNVVSQFTELLMDDGPGGKSNEYILNVIAREISPIEYALVDEEDDVILRLNLSRIVTHPKYKIKIDIQPWSLEVKIRGLLQDYFLKICRFFAQIDARRSVYIRRDGYLFIQLRKVEAGKWDHLIYYHPEVIENFQKNFSEHIKSCPVLQTRDNSVLLDIWSLEILPNVGHDFRYYLINDCGVELPKDVITIEQIIEFMKSDIKPSSSEDECTLLGTAFLIHEKKKFSETHSGTVNEYYKCPQPKRSTHRKAEEWNRKGKKAFEQSEFLRAVEAYTKAIELDAECATYYTDRLIVYLKLNLLQNCLDDLGRAIFIDPFNAVAYLYMGKYLLIKGLPKEANEELRKAKILDPPNTEVDKYITEAWTFENYIRLYTKAIRLKDKKSKTDHLKSIANVVDPSVASETLLTILCDEGLISEAKEEIPNLSSIHNNSAYMKLNYLAICSYYEDDEETFQEYFRKAKKERPPSIKTEYCGDIAEFYSYRKKGDNCFKNGQYKEAITWYDKGLALHDIIPKLTSKLHYKAACAYFKEEEDDIAIFQLDEAIEKNSNYHEAFAARGELYMRQNEFTDALNDFKNAYKLSPCSSYQELIEKAKTKQPLDFITFGDNSVRKKNSKRKMNKKCEKQIQMALSEKEIGNKHFASKRYVEAIDSYSEAIKFDPKNPVYYSNRAACYIILKNFNEGLRDSEKAVSLDASFVKGLFRMGQCYIALGRSERAIYALEKANELKSDDKTILQELVSANVLREMVKKGHSAFVKQKYDRAENFYSVALSKAERCVELLLKKIECMIYLERFDEAIEVSEMACDLDKTNYKAFYYSGICFFHTKCYEKSIHRLEYSLSWNREKKAAFQALNIIYKLEAGSYNSRKKKAMILETKKIFLADMKLSNVVYFEDYKEGQSSDEGESSCDTSSTSTKAFSESTLATEVYVQRAVNHLKMKNYREALTEAKKVVKRDSLCLKGFLLIGECNIAIGNFEEALSAFEAAKNINPSNEEVFACIEKVLTLKNCVKDAETAFQKNNYLAAYELYRNAMEIASASAHLLVNFAECLIKLQKLAELSKLVNSLNDDLKSSHEYLFVQGLSTYHSHYNDDESINSIKMALSKDPTNEVYQKYVKIIESVYDKMTQGFDLFQSRNFDEAFDFFEEILNIDPDNNIFISEAHYYIGVIMLKKNNVTEAVEHFSKAIDKREDYISALEKRALCYRKLKRRTDAINDYNTLFKCTNQDTYREIAYDLQKTKELRHIYKEL